MNTYILSQILAIIATIFIGLSYLAKNKKNIMLLCVIYCIFYSSHYLLLKAHTGTMMSLVSAIRNISFYYCAKNNLNNRKITLILFWSIGLVSGFISYQDPFSLVSIIASLISTYSIWQNNVKLYRLLAIPVSICFIIYAIHIKSLFSLITELFLLVIEIIGVIELYLSNKKILKEKLS